MEKCVCVLFAPACSFKKTYNKSSWNYLSSDVYRGVVFPCLLFFHIWVVAIVGSSTLKISSLILCTCFHTYNPLISSPQPGFGTGRERDGIGMREGCGKGTGIHTQFPHSRYFFYWFQVRCMKAKHHLWLWWWNELRFTYVTLVGNHVFLKNLLSSSVFCLCLQSYCCCWNELRITCLRMI